MTDTTSPALDHKVPAHQGVALTYENLVSGRLLQSLGGVLPATALRLIVPEDSEVAQPLVESPDGLTQPVVTPEVADMLARLVAQLPDTLAADPNLTDPTNELDETPDGDSGDSEDEGETPPVEDVEDEDASEADTPADVTPAEESTDVDAPVEEPVEEPAKETPTA